MHEAILASAHLMTWREGAAFGQEEAEAVLLQLVRLA